MWLALWVIVASANVPPDPWRPDWNDPPAPIPPFPTEPAAMALSGAILLVAAQARRSSRPEAATA